MTNVEVHNEVRSPQGSDGWTLCFQRCTYHHTSPAEPPEHGFRFIWRRPDNSLQPARGQARIPDRDTLIDLLDKATVEGWF